MLWYQLLIESVPAVIAIVTGILLVHGAFKKIQFDVGALTVSVGKMEKDIAVMRSHQQAAAYGHPQKGVLPPLATDEAPERTPAEETELEGRVGDLEEGIIKDLRIHKVDDPPEGDE